MCFLIVLVICKFNYLITVYESESESESTRKALGNSCSNFHVGATKIKRDLKVAVIVLCNKRQESWEPWLPTTWTPLVPFICYLRIVKWQHAWKSIVKVNYSDSLLHNKMYVAIYVTVRIWKIILKNYFVERLFTRNSERS